MPTPLARVLLPLLTVLALGVPGAALLAAPDPPELEDFWVGDVPGDAGGMLAVRWRNRKSGPVDRFWRVEVKQVALPDGKGGMVEVDGPVRSDRPGALSSDFQSQERFLRDLPGPWWCWPPVADPFKDTHWVAVDLLRMFPPARA